MSENDKSTPNKPNGNFEADFGPSGREDSTTTDSQDEGNTDKVVSDDVAGDKPVNDKPAASKADKPVVKKTKPKPTPKFEAAPPAPSWPEDSDDASPDGRPTVMPKQTRYALIGLFALGAVLLLIAGVIFFGRETRADQLLALYADEVKKGTIEAGEVPTREQLVSGALFGAALQGGLAAIILVGAWFTLKGKQWGRLLAMAGATFVGVLLLQSVLTGAIDPVTLVILIVTVASLFFLANRNTAAWCGSLRRK